ncbi:polysaccharide deacetylase family protein [Nocardioides sp. LML1-1-1.1]|uniref:polysaccharide deacetylase family protein n=1 Tax=Nocardioides sp. LML1-1-1.1 TaxID=3135248 RepID=UPI0034227296
MSVPRARVLMYHGVDRVSAARDPYGMFVSPAAFRRQMECLLEAGYVPVSEDDYLAAVHGARLQRKAVLVTFDDGYLGVGEHAAPVLRELGVPSVLYVPADRIGGTSDWLEERHRHRLMDAADLREVAAAGMTIGAHAADHRDLRGLADAELTVQTRQAREHLEGVVGAPVRSFAFPYGHHDERARAAVRAAGLEAGFGIWDAADELAIGRVDVNATDTLRTFRLKLRRFYPALRRATDPVPSLRRRAHDLLGRAPRETPDGRGAEVGSR